MISNEIRNPLFYVRVKQDAFSDPATSFIREKLQPDVEYPVVAVVSDRFVLVAENGDFIELYPRKCVFAGSPEN